MRQRSESPFYLSQVHCLSLSLLICSLGCWDEPEPSEQGSGGALSGVMNLEGGQSAGALAGATSQAGLSAGFTPEAGAEAGATVAGEAGATAGALAGYMGGGQAGLEAGVTGGVAARAGAEAGAEAGAPAGSDAGLEAGAGAGSTVSPECQPEWETLRDEALREALYQLSVSRYVPIEVEPDLGGNPNRYTTARRHMFTNVERRDGGVRLLYLGRQYELAEGTEPDHSVINCEHSWPRSKLADPDTEPAAYEHQQSDLHQLYPAQAEANSARGSLPYGEVESNRNLSYLPSELGLNASNREVFEPRDEVKGDLARTYFYMSTRWKLELSAHEEEVMRRWHLDDPVDSWERERNARITSLQGNPNPFVLCPSLVAQISDFTGEGVQEQLPLP